MKPLSYLIYITLFIFSSHIMTGQKKSRADRYFEKGDYINAAALYEEELNQEGYAKHILQNISISYYNSFQFKKAYRYLTMLVKGKFYNSDKSYDNKFNFIMHQLLSTTGNYDKAVEFLALYHKNKELPFDKVDAIATIEDFKLKENDYTIKPVLFNSDASDFAAIKKDSSVYFVSDRTPNRFLNKDYKWTHRPFLDIYRVTVDDKNEFTQEPAALPRPLNSKLHEGNFCFSKDGNTIYFSKSNTVKGKKKFDSLNNNVIHLYKASLIDGKWSKPEKLSFNQSMYSMEHPNINAAENRLYFASNIPGGYGDFDLYYVDILSDGSFGNPINLGETINTANREQFPFIHNNGHLFFSSNGHLGLGMMDIFVAEQTTTGNFKIPVNLGAPINSTYDDFSINYTNDTEGFFASNRKKFNDDIYQFTQTGEILLKEYTVRIEIKDYASEELIADADVLITYKSKEVSKKQLGTLSRFQIKTIPGQYTINANALGYLSKTKTIRIKEQDEATYVIYLQKAPTPVATVETPKATPSTTPNIPTQKRRNTAIKSPNRNVNLKQQLLTDKVGPPVIERDGKLFFDLPPIQFDYDKWIIRKDSKKILDQLAQKLDKYRTVYIKIGSHTDSRGTDTYNQMLSEKRAEATRNYLALIGYVNARRMQFKGYGESQLLIDCQTNDCGEKEHQINRRSEFEILKY